MRIGLAALFTLACLHIGVGLAGVFVAPVGVEASLRNPLWVYALQIVVYGGTGAYLTLASRRDPRARVWGALLLLTAAAYSRRPAAILQSSLPDVAANLIGVVQNLPADAFTPWLAWVFVGAFPRAVVSRTATRAAASARNLSLAAGLFLLAANALLLVPQLADSRFLLGFSHADDFSYYWAAFYGLSLPALPYALWKARRARGNDRRRITAFLAAILVATLPLAFLVVLSVVSTDFAAFVESSAGRTLLLPATQVLVLSVPLMTAYSIAVDHVLDVKILIRKATQYGLARFVATLVAVSPWGWMAWYLYRARGETLADLIGGPQAIVPAVAFGAGIGAWYLRRRSIDLIDRLFFREQHDGRRILERLIELSGGPRGANSLPGVLAREIDRALHLDKISVLVADPPTHLLAPDPPSVRPLELSSSLASLLRIGEPVEVDLERPSRAIGGLPEEERRWLAEAAFRLILPLIASDGSLLGAVALGEKRSELPLSREDRLLLSAVCSTAAVTLERGSIRNREGSRAAAVEAEEARECVECGTIAATFAARCEACGSDVATAPVPQVLLGKFRMKRRIGVGGMGVVYEAIDLALDRRVAVKTLPDRSPEECVRLRREARAMALVTHPNLATIYGAETWRATPLLIVELLEGGTLADRLESAPLPVEEALELGSVLADVLDRVHSAGVLHRDVKPSNIGFLADGTPKLLDFGLAEMMRDEEMSFDGARGPSDDSSFVSSIDVFGLGGTPIYMSPESLTGERLAPAVDLWATSLVLFEAITGRNPIVRETWAETRRAILQADVPDVREFVDCGVPVSELFAGTLHVDRRRRPGTASQLRRRIEEARSQLGRSAA